MDLLSEGSSVSRILTARHISAEEPLQDVNKALTTTNIPTTFNTTLLCYSQSIEPDVGSYVEALHPWIWIIWSCGVVVMLATYVLFAVTMKSAVKHWRGCITHVGVLLSVYPLIATFSFIVLLVPRARLLGEALAQQVVMVALYHLFEMFIAECGDEDKMISWAEDTRLQTRVPPLCCWPCCLIPQPKLNRKNLTWVRYLILQMIPVQALIYIITLVLWAENKELYQASFMYIQPFVAASILSGVWGVIMSVKTVKTLGVRPLPRFLALQLVLIIVKLQCAFAKFIGQIETFPCFVDGLNPFVLVNQIHYGILMLEMLLLSLWAWRLYRVPPNVSSTVTKVVVAVTEESANTKKMHSKM